MIGIGAVAMPTSPSAYQYRLAFKHWDTEGCSVKISLPRDALLGSILDDQGSVHSTGLALEVFTLSLMRINLPSCSTSATECHIVIHPIILANHSGKVALKLQGDFSESTMSVLSYLHYHLALLPIELIFLGSDSMQQDNSISILLNATRIS
jgi:hypothetical protein